MADGNAFTAADVVLSKAPGRKGTWVSFPFAAGCPEIMRSLGGKWDQVAKAWAVPDSRMEDLRSRLNQLAELVRVQEAIDLAYGRAPGKAKEPAMRSAAPLTRVTVVGDGWSPVPGVTFGRESLALADLGCASRGTDWFAPDQATADEALATLARVREAVAQAKADKERAAAEAQALKGIELARVAELKKLVDPVFGNHARTAAELERLVPLVPYWKQARWTWKAYSKLLDGQGQEPRAWVALPGGRKVEVTAFCPETRQKLSRRVDLVEIAMPEFPKASGIVTSFVRGENGKRYESELEGYEPEPAPEPPPVREPVAAPEPVKAATPAVAASDPPLTKANLRAIRECMRTVGKSDAIATEDSRFARAASLLVLDRPDVAASCRPLIVRHRTLLRPEAVEDALAGWSQTPEPAPPSRKPGAGRKPKGERAMTKAERTAAWRAGKKLVTVEVPADVAARLRQVRDALGGTLGEAMAAALDALAKAA